LAAAGALLGLLLPGEDVIHILANPWPPTAQGVMHRRSGADPLITILLGIAGALLGGFLGRAIGLYGPREGAGFVMALIGALTLLGLYRLLVARRAPACRGLTCRLSGSAWAIAELQRSDHEFLIWDPAAAGP
jgi:uncharacterized membrane protein YeaQ/YmgE (transglycosylase-associated protein family)